MKEANKGFSVRRLVLSALFLALAFVLPFLTGQVQQIGRMLCPMHIPVLLCGFICGWQWGLAVGVTAPLLRSLTLTMPPLFPAAVCMAAELAVYGAVAGLMYKLFPKKIGYVYLSLLISMVCGRIVWGAAMFACMGFDATKFGLDAFLTGAVTTAVPGIIIQIVLVPTLVFLVNGTNGKCSGLQ